ncbi:hypothetical protein SynMITS9220_02935 [Synechococcus sp. MIT S9220]|nr:hypothetical protein SynMITS9220_02935 [Synechococcus sp. MIT S9220]
MPGSVSACKSWFSAALGPCWIEFFQGLPRLIRSVLMAPINTPLRWCTPASQGEPSVNLFSMSTRQLA